jgi:hypothetical protein
VSSSHRHPQTRKGSINRSRNWWRASDQRRERRPAGTKAAHPENGGSNGNDHYRLSLRARGSSEYRRLRRRRYMRQIWPLGDRTCFELPTRSFNLDGVHVDHVFGRFAGLDGDILWVLGADGLPSVPPPRLVGGPG